MNTIIYTYKNKKPVFFELPRFYKINSAKEYDKLIERLFYIDAVFSPYSPEEVKTYPIYLELQAGFSPSLEEVSENHIREQIKAANKLLG